MERFDSELQKGTTELLVLSILDREELHGYALIKRLRALSGERFRMNEGALYPLLHRLVREKKLQVSTRSQGGRERKTYRLTAAGRRALAAAATAWRDYAGFVDAVVRGEET